MENPERKLIRTISPELKSVLYELADQPEPVLTEALRKAIKARRFEDKPEEKQ